MAYQTYITEALVCGTWSSNTADKSILLFAREAGMVYAQARSVREERSKQRYALQEASCARVTLIRGKNGWKVAGAEPMRNLYGESKTRESRALLRDTILLLRRVIQGESPHPELFDDVTVVLARSGEFQPKVLEAVLFLRILHVLGYVAPEGSYAELLRGPFPFKKLEVLPESAIAELKGVVENALLESQL